MLASSLSICKLPAPLTASQISTSLSVNAAALVFTKPGASDALSTSPQQRTPSLVLATACPSLCQDAVFSSSPLPPRLLEISHCSLRKTITRGLSVPSASPQGFGRYDCCCRSGDGGGLFHTTRVAYALVPVNVKRHERSLPGSRGAMITHFLNASGQPITRAQTVTGTASASLAPALQEVKRSPTDLLADMPVYPANDFNGPPLTRQKSYVSMRTLPMSHALTFYYRDQNNSNASGSASVTSGSSSSSTSGSSSGVRAGSGGGSMYALQDEEDGEEERVRSRFGRSTRENEAPLFCRLCREEIQPPASPRSHITKANIGSHVSHPVREIVLDTVTLLALRGYPIDDALTVWAETLYRSSALPRVAGMTDPCWSLERRARCLGDLMHALKKAGVIDISLSRFSSDGCTETVGVEADKYRRRRVGFERLEYIGDSFWSINVSQRLVQLFPDQQWLSGERSCTFNAVRDAVEMNTNLDFVFDVLQLENLLSVVRSETLGTGKAKADFVEAILGELHMYAIALEPKLDDDVAYVEVNGAREAQLCALVQHCLSELYDLVVLQHARQLLVTAVPLAKELAAHHMWLQMRPALLPAKRSSRSQEKGQYRPGFNVGKSNDGMGSQERDVASQPVRDDAADGSVSAPEATTAAGDDDNSNVPAADAAAGAEDVDGIAISRKVETGSLLTSAMQEDGGSGDGTSSASAEEPAYVSFNDAAGLTDAATLGSSEATSSTAADAANSTGALTSPIHDISATAQPGVRGAALPTFRSFSFSLAAAIQRGTTRALPGLPRLFASPRPLPSHVPDPLRRLPLSDIPRETYCEHTKADVFAQLIESYHRLGLVEGEGEEEAAGEGNKKRHPATARPRYVISPRPPQWAALISDLVPQLPSMEEDIGVEGGVEETEMPPSTSKNDVSHLLFPAPQTSTKLGGLPGRVTAFTEHVTAAEAAVAVPRPSSEVRRRGVEDQNGERVRRLFASMDGGDFYVRDSFYDLQASPSPPSPTLPSSPTITRNAQDLDTASLPSTLNWVLRHCGLPRLTAKPTQVAGQIGGGGGLHCGGADGLDGFGVGIFADSRFVPPGTRTPSAGVVTDRNLCRGAFAFLACGVQDPLKEFYNFQNTARKLSTRIEKSESGCEEEKSKGERSDGSTPSTDVQSAEDIQAAILYWKRQKRNGGADPELFVPARPNGAERQPSEPVKAGYAVSGVER